MKIDGREDTQMRIPSRPNIEWRQLRVWFLLGFIVSFLDVHTAYAIWRYYGSPDFYFRAGGSVPFLVAVMTPWWMILFVLLAGFLRLTGLSVERMSLVHFLAIIVLVSAALTALHLYEFHVHRLTRGGFSSSLVALVVVLVELVARLWAIRKARARTGRARLEPGQPPGH
jgi:hypothetical protein